MPDIDSYDVALVGAGPIGIEMAVALKSRGVEYIHFEAAQIGQAIVGFPAQTPFFSSPERIAIAGVPLQTVDQTKATREEYLTYLRCVVQQFDLPIRLGERLLGVTRDDDGFVLETRTDRGTHLTRARRLILGTGNMQRPRRLGVPGEDLPHVSHWFGEAHTYFRRRLLVIGGKNSAVEAALRCYRAGAHVTLLHRREEIHERVKYWLRPEILSLIQAGHIGWMPSRCVSRIEPGRVETVPADADGCAVPEGPAAWVEADAVLALTGYEQDQGVFRELGLELMGEEQRPRVNHRTMETSVPGVYVIGTAAAGSERSVRVFIETSHVHVRRVMAAVTGEVCDDEGEDAHVTAHPEA